MVNFSHFRKINFWRYSRSTFIKGFQDLWESLKQLDNFMDLQIFNLWYLLHRLNICLKISVIRFYIISNPEPEIRCLCFGCQVGEAMYQRREPARIKIVQDYSIIKGFHPFLLIPCKSVKKKQTFPLTLILSAGNVASWVGVPPPSWLK